MQLAGKLVNPEDLIDLLELLNRKGGGCLVLSFLHPLREIKICVRDGKVCFNVESDLPVGVYLKILVEDWYLNRRHPVFEILRVFDCDSDYCVSFESMKDIFSLRRLRDLDSLPREFVVEKAGSSVPKFLRSAHLIGKVVTFEDLHSNGISLLDLVEWIAKGEVIIKPYREGTFISLLWRFAFSLLLLLALVLVVLPRNYDRIAILDRRNEILNKVLVDKVLGKPVDFSVPDYSGKVDFDGKKVFVETRFGRYFVGRIPEKGYIPFFEVPAK